MTQPRRAPRLLSYRLSLAVAVPALAGLTGGVVTGLNAYFTHRSLEKMSQRIFREVSLHAVERTRSQLGAAVPAVQTASALLGELAHRDDPELPQALFRIARANPSFTWVSYSDDSGAFTGIFHGADGAWRLNVSRIHDGKTELNEYELAGLPEADALAHRKLRRHELDSGYDPRQRPFYRLALGAGAPVWTEPYVFYEAGVPGISCAVPHRDEHGVVTGVFTVDLDLNRLSEMAASLKPTENGRVFLYTEDRTLLAHPTVRLVEKSGQRGEGTLLTTRQVNDPALQDYVAAASDPALKLAAQGDAVALLQFMHNGERYRGSFDTVEVDGGVSWIVGIFAPESDLLGDAQRSVLLATATSVLAVLLALGLSVFLANRMSKPLAEVAAEMEKVGDFRLEPRTLPATPFREIAVLTKTMEAMKGSLRSFANYVPRKLVRSLMASGQEASLGGRVKELTVFFSDIANFTGFAESMKPDELVQRLGVYLEEMTRAIEGQGGTVDKFIGDGIMAFWGAPEEIANGPLQAAIAALLCQKKLAELRSGAAHPWMKQWNTRIGLATGEVLVGNIGTPERMNYTVMGDTANLASRLEGLNKAYGTLCLVDEATARAAGDRVVARALDVVAVKGKAKGVRVYELLALAEDADATVRELARRSEAALGAYLKRDFAQAAEQWRSVLALRPSDPAAQVMLARCDELTRSPPPADWTGIHHALEK